MAASYDKLERFALLALHAARIGKEKSTAMEARFYRNPAETVLFEAEIERKRKAAQLKREKGK